MRVLLVEDDLTAAHGVSLMLKSAGAVVEHAETGEEAIELTRHYEYDIVLLDVILPDVEGYEVVRRMRNSRNDTPVLILSGLSRPQAKVKGLGLGADDFICKLRKKLAVAGADNLIGTVWGRGYMIREPAEDLVEPLAAEPNRMPVMRIAAA